LALVLGSATRHGLGFGVLQLHGNGLGGPAHKKLFGVTLDLASNCLESDMLLKASIFDIIHLLSSIWYNMENFVFNALT